VAAGTVLVGPAGGSGPVLETTHACTALPGAVAAVAVLADGWLVVETPDDLGGLAPFGARRRAPAELWVGVRTPAQPQGLFSLAIRHSARPGRLSASRSASTVPDPPPAVRWEAFTAAGPVELAVERDGTRGLTRDGVLVVRAETPNPWTPRTLPGRAGDPPLIWLRARLTTGSFPADALLAAITVNGVATLARRTIRGEVAEPIERRPSGRSRYRLSQVPIVPGSVRLDIADTAGDPFGIEADVASEWEEVPTLAGVAPDRRAFTLDPGSGILTFGDGVQGRAVPAGYRNVVALEYATGGGTTGLPRAGDALSSERSLPGLTGATVLTITTGADAEAPGEMLRRGGATSRSRQRAVAPADYAALAAGTPGVEVARAHALPARDARLGAGAVPGYVTVVVLPVAESPDRPPTPSAETLAAVAEHLSGATGVLGASVVTVSPAFRDVAVNALLMAAPGADPATLESLARARIDRWLSPTQGGDGTGWPFGGTVRWDALVRVLVAEVDGLDAVARLSFRVGGRRLAPCADVPLAPDELVWPGIHVLETQRSGGQG
jgi:predicted phage baseplate assembly protein